MEEAPMNATESRLLVQQSLDSFRAAEPIVEPGERTRDLTVVCLLGFVQCAFAALVLLFVGLGGLALLVGLALLAIEATCLSGLWRMRAWSIPAYFAFMALFHLLAAIGGGISVFDLILTIATVIIALRSVDDMG
jgi:hypothetical protein